MPRRLTPRQQAFEKVRILSEQWPHWPLLPMKRWVGETHRLDDLDTGIMIAGVWNKVFKTNLFAIALGVPEKRTVAQIIDGLEVETFADLDAVLDAGWMGD